ncbi:MAG TPA: UDP-N-acetylmuramate--L-alanine ligase [Syntrophales bacterium]|nr:UDP-N-acetylmuramate--L-alanine ligase [Syntrophales bacterium]HOX93264.1 UDP-N-acetylmuramate--L-alanine ligase [Syntrophales bacterium]HPI56262.1 UDP-N-acetylmuramate--L-alanine ligase [Syntrophales bacterium]HPN24449.1 UDP-N-acetylmuramate--L-alanine ligase [Syntrophales bacterium]HQM29079.1 UDP-N-acetylmuramate--L-alanine ligase [Syntrophales bacterium]
MMDNHRQRDLMQRKIQRIHFVGIGGIGMSGIAEVLLNLGYQVSGSDLQETELTQRLASMGARVFYGHRQSNLQDADVVVTSTAVKAENPEVLEAHYRSIPVIPRAEMLAELLKMKFSIAVSGMHGKTTTTSMIATLLAHGGLDPTVVIGGKLGSIGSNARLGNGEVIVAEADESDGSFLKLGPSIAVITNIDREHLDYYRDIQDIKEAFLKFANLVPFYGTTILCMDDEHVRDILPGIKRRTITYGINRAADYQARNISIQGASSRYEVYYRGEKLGDIQLNVPGLFNVYNSMAAVAVGRELDMDCLRIHEGLKAFTGVHRRLEVKGRVNDITVIDDYGHHPTEIVATLAAAKQVWKDRLIVVFQPHRYTRTRALFKEFLTAFYDADVLVIMDIYAASEAPIEGVNSRKLFEGIQNKGHKQVLYLGGPDRVVDYLLETARPGDAIITQGAGNVWRVGEEFLKKARGR